MKNQNKRGLIGLMEKKVSAIGSSKLTYAKTHTKNDS